MFTEKIIKGGEGGGEKLTSIILNRVLTNVTSGLSFICYFILEVIETSIASIFQKDL